MNTLLGRDIFLRHTTSSGDSYVMSHRVWDAERFIASQQAAADKVNEQAKDDTQRKARVEQITAEQYEKERKARS